MRCVARNRIYFLFMFLFKLQLPRLPLRVLPKKCIIDKLAVLISHSLSPACIRRIETGYLLSLKTTSPPKSFFPGAGIVIPKKRLKCFILCNKII